jgi:hypothetical protein
MRSAECQDAAADSPAEQGSAREGQADFDRRHQVLDQPQADLDLLLADSDLALAFAPLAQLRAPVDSQHLLLLPTHSRHGHLFPATTISSGSTTGLDFAIFIIITSVFLTPAWDASRRSSAPDYFGVRPTILLTTVAITPTTMERRRPSLLS